MAVLGNLKPAEVWKHFEAMCGIPHPSGHEEAIAAYVIEQAKKLGLPHRRDKVGNVVITKPASKGREKAPVLVLQGHLDMVGVAAPGVKHDFLKDPIKPVIKGDYVYADGTTLGADNGIGGAIMLAVMEDKSLVHPEIEFFFTINEEAGMDGAHGLEADFIKGRRLINLDTEEFGEFYISCAGGGDSAISFPAPRAAADKGATTMKVKVGGLKGGHSGADINLGRASGNKVMARLLAGAKSVAPLRLRTVKGGNKRNSIADGAEALFDVSSAKAEDVRKEMLARAEVMKSEVAKVDPGLSVEVTAEKAGGPEPLTAEATAKVIDLLVALPHGVIAMSPEVPGLVETSTNIGTVETGEKDIRIVLLSRSAQNSSLPMMKERIRTIAGFVGAKVEEPRGYPGWKPNMDSELLKIGKQVYQKLYGAEPKVKAIHAGLECGIFSERLKGVDMISIGPSMADVHSPAERLFIPHVDEFYKLLVKYLEALV